MGNLLGKDHIICTFKLYPSYNKIITYTFKHRITTALEQEFKHWWRNTVRLNNRKCSRISGYNISVKIGGKSISLIKCEGFDIFCVDQECKYIWKDHLQFLINNYYSNIPPPKYRESTPSCPEAIPSCPDENEMVT